MRSFLRNDADEVIYPDRDMVEKLALRHSTNPIYNYAELSGEYYICEMHSLPEWIGKSVREFGLDLEELMQNV